MLTVTEAVLIAILLQGMLYSVSFSNICRRRMINSLEPAPCRLVAVHVFPDVLDLDPQREGQTTLQLYDASSDYSLIVAIHDGVFKLLLSICRTED